MPKQGFFIDGWPVDLSGISAQSGVDLLTGAWADFTLVSDREYIFFIDGCQDRFTRYTCPELKHDRKINNFHISGDMAN